MIDENSQPIVLDNVDASGVRLYVSNELRSYDLGGLTFGVHSLPSSIAIPPQMPSFAIDSYCGADASRSVCYSSLTKTWIKVLCSFL